MTLSIMTLSITTFSIVVNKMRHTQHNSRTFLCRMSLNLIVTYAECHIKAPLLNVVILSVTLKFIMLSVVAPLQLCPKRFKSGLNIFSISPCRRFSKHKVVIFNIFGLFYILEHTYEKVFKFKASVSWHKVRQTSIFIIFYYKAQ